MNKYCIQYEEGNIKNYSFITADTKEDAEKLFRNKRLFACIIETTLYYNIY